MGALISRLIRANELSCMPEAPVARPWQRFLRLTVRGLIVLVLLIGAGLGWLVRSARIQREAVAAIETAEGEVSYDWGRKDRRCCATSAVNKSRNRSVDCPLDMRHDSPDAETARRSEPPD